MSKFKVNDLAYEFRDGNVIEHIILAVTVHSDINGSLSTYRTTKGSPLTDSVLLTKEELVNVLKSAIARYQELVNIYSA